MADRIVVHTNPPRFEQMKGLMLKRFNRAMRDVHHEVSNLYVGAIKSSIADSNTVATKNLLNSVTARFIEGQHYSSREFISSIGFKGSAEDYAEYANYGRPAGNPPPEGIIEDWLRAKISRGLFNVVSKTKTSRTTNKKTGKTRVRNRTRKPSIKALAYIIESRIAEKGTKGSQFMERAEDKMYGVADKILDRAVDRFLQENKI